MVITSFPQEQPESDDPQDSPDEAAAQDETAESESQGAQSLAFALKQTSDPDGSGRIVVSAEPPQLPKAALPPEADRRLYSLDALRGLAILLMCLSGILPKFLPNWMYHGYYPSYLPDAEGNLVAVENPYVFHGQDWPSFTWVDWVFPMFLFAMGAAIPLAMHARRMRGTGAWALAGHSVARFFVLVGFAVYVEQIVVTKINPAPTLADRWLSILGLFVLLPILARLPRTLSRGTVLGIRLLGVLAAVVLLGVVNDVETNPPFTWNSGQGDVDIIILLLAWASLVASLLWLITRFGGWVGWAVRLILGLSLALVAHNQGMIPEWRVFETTFDPLMAYVHDAPRAWLDLRWLNDHLPGHLPEGLLDLSPLYNFTWFKFLWVVIPGTIIGDLVVRHMQEQHDRSGIARPVNPDPHKAKQAVVQLWGLGRHLVITAALLAALLAVLYGLKDYATSQALFAGLTLDTPYSAVLLGLPPLVLALVAMVGKPGPDGRYLRRLTLWGTAWLTAGLTLAVMPNFGTISPDDVRYGATYFEGGVSKGPPARLSWYLVSLGMSILLLAVLAVWIDARKWRWPFGLLIANGQNPMLAYTMVHATLAAVVGLPLLMVFVGDSVPASPEAFVAYLIEQWHGEDASLWHDVGWDVLKTLALAAVVWAATKRRLVLRA